MSKNELIQAIKTAVTALSVYDTRYYKVERDAIYMRANKNQLHQLLADLQNRVLFAKRATDLGANIVSRSNLRGKDLQLIIKAGIVCRDVGIGFVEERPATDTDIKTMLVII
jgi:hypothetical protein